MASPPSLLSVLGAALQQQHASRYNNTNTGAYTNSNTGVFNSGFAALGQQGYQHALQQQQMYHPNLHGYGIGTVAPPLPNVTSQNTSTVSTVIPQSHHPSVHALQKGFSKPVFTTATASSPDPIEGWQLRANEIYLLPDNSVLTIDTLGNAIVTNTAQVVTHRITANRPFNKYVNGSDLLAEFVKYVKEDMAAVKPLRTPVEAFINWVILRAAEADGDPADDLPSVQDGIEGKPAAAHELPYSQAAAKLSWPERVRNFWLFKRYMARGGA